MRPGQTHEGVHETAMLGGHGEKDFFEGIRVIVDEGKDATEAVDEVVEEATVDIGFDAIDQDGEGARNGSGGRMTLGS